MIPSFIFIAVVLLEQIFDGYASDDTLITPGVYLLFQAMIFVSAYFTITRHAIMLLNERPLWEKRLTQILSGLTAIAYTVISFQKGWGRTLSHCRNLSTVQLCEVSRLSTIFNDNFFLIVIGFLMFAVVGILYFIERSKTLRKFGIFPSAYALLMLMTMPTQVSFYFNPLTCSLLAFSLAAIAVDRLKAD